MPSPVEEAITPPLESRRQQMSAADLDIDIEVDPTDPRVCPQCDDTFDYDDGGQWCDYCGAPHCDYCDMCYLEDDCHCGCQDDQPRCIHDWSYRPNPYRPKGEYPGQALLGVELEVGGRAHAIASVVRVIDQDEYHLYMKEDGSISGVEIVTHPMTLAWSRDYPFTRLLDNLGQAGCSVDDGYGLHIHVSRNAFRRKPEGPQSHQHAMAWLMFMYRNADALQQLARRESSRWASFREPGVGQLRRKAAALPLRDDRYVAVNCNNERTYELRFFRATLNPQEFLAALEFADASVEYTRTVSTAEVLKGGALTFGHFAKFVANDERYRNLDAEVRRLGLGSGKGSIVKPFSGGPHRTMMLPEAARRAGVGGVIARIQHSAYVVGRSNGIWTLRPEGWTTRSAQPLSTYFQDDWRVVRVAQFEEPVLTNPF